MSTYRTGNHWGVTIVREGTEPPDATGHHPDAQLVAVVVNGDQALAERICALLNGGKTGGPRSTLGDQIVMGGPYSTGQVRPAWMLEALASSTDLNGLRDELIALRDIATGREA